MPSKSSTKEPEAVGFTGDDLAKLEQQVETLEQELKQHHAERVNLLKTHQHELTTMNKKWQMKLTEQTRHLKQVADRADHAEQELRLIKLRIRLAPSFPNNYDDHLLALERGFKPRYAEFLAELEHIVRPY